MNIRSYFSTKSFCSGSDDNVFKSYKNIKEFNGISLLNVWASWCITCLVEHPFLTQLSNNNIKLIGLNYKDSQIKAKQWLRKRGDPYLFSIYDPRGDLAFDLGVTGAPETFLIFNQKIIY